jgi:hypothetical protein
MRGHLPVPLSTGIGEGRPPSRHSFITQPFHLKFEFISPKKTEIRSETMSNIIDHQHLIDL